MNHGVCNDGKLLQPAKKTRPQWRKPVMIESDVATNTETRVCGSGSDSFPGWCARVGS